MNPWLIMLLGGLLTFATRLSFILLFGRAEPPAWLRRALRFVPTAVLTAIIVPEVLMQSGSPNFSLVNSRLTASLVAIGVAWGTRSTLLTILIGMIALWGFEALR